MRLVALLVPATAARASRERTAEDAAHANRCAHGRSARAGLRQRIRLDPRGGE
jgi:hypothetical protein